MSNPICMLCVERKHKVYYGEMSDDLMEETGTTYWKCYNCNYEPLIWSNGVGDASCESCGEWQDGKEH